MDSHEDNADWGAWASVPWNPVTDSPTSTAETLGWHKSGVPYVPRGQAVALQTLDVWIPAAGITTNPLEPSYLPSLPGTWIVYIHGGAWRDPFITSASFTSAATNLLRRVTTTATTTQSTQSKPSAARIAGLISLNYRLSPHPSHPCPAPDLPSRQARHPDHIADVLTALAFLNRLGILPSDSDSPWILAGHSCGATLAFQSVMAPARWGLAQVSNPTKPRAIVGFNGLYDLAGFIAEPPAAHAHLREGYREFVSGAFGADDEGVWRAVCPATAGEGWVGEWIGGSGGGARGRRRPEAVLVQSWEDSLVPYEQLEAMRGRLEGEGKGVVDVRVVEAGGDHNDIWSEGIRMGEILWEVVEALSVA
ncbi:alpha/beta-hydrolase [Parathielavia appendiculata]|uniref:Kynurenine formamidase n=1 Tax=Parathielavia appendiculata TaxID=2587402 RepID=A0AAN6Z023_9PEZI|nr:alpha/beta-hydrolase [Parathielavia appendiculata]